MKEREVYLNISSLFLESQGNCVLTHRGDLIYGFKIEYPAKYSQSKEDFERQKKTWDLALRNLPTKTIVCKSDVYIKTFFSAKDMPKDNFIQKATAEHFEGRPYLDHTGYVFFIWPQNDTLKNNQIKNPFRPVSVKGYKSDQINFANFETQVKQARQILNNSETVYLEPLQQSEVMHFCSIWLNGFNMSVATDVVFEKDRVVADDMHLAMIALTDETGFPDAIVECVPDDTKSIENGFYKGMVDYLGITLNCNHVYNQILIIDDNKTHIDRIYKTQEALFGLRKLGHENIKAHEKIDGYLKEMTSSDDSNNVHFVRGHSNIILFDKNIEIVNQAKTDIVAWFTKEGFSSYTPTGERLKNMYLNTLCINAPMLNNNSMYLVDLRAATCLFIMNGAYTNDNEGIYFQDRIFNIPFKFDFWDEPMRRIVSRNFAIFAPTGRGKSVIANAIESGLIDTQDVVVVNIDLGRSYEKLSKLYKPEDVGYFRYESGKPLGLNPFILEEGEQPTELKIEEVCEVVWTNIKKNGSTTALEKTSMRKIVKAYFICTIADDGVSALSWPGFYNFVKINYENDQLFYSLDIENDPKFFDIKEFLHAGSDFIGDGIYSNIFAATDKEIYNSFVGKKLIIFELEEIKDNMLLVTIMLQIISEAITRIVWKDRSRRALVLFDEFAETLKMPGILSKVAYYAQAIRKQNGMLGLILQAASQFPDTPDGKSILANTETLIVLPTDNKVVIDSLEERTSLSKYDRIQIESMRHNFNGEIKYSEFFLKRGSFSRVMRLELAPKALIAYETRGNRATEIMKLYNQHGSMEEAINKYLELHPQNN